MSKLSIRIYTPQFSRKVNSAEGSLHGKLHNSAAKGKAARVTLGPQVAISATFRPLRHNRTLLIQHEVTRRICLLIQQTFFFLNFALLSAENTKNKTISLFGNF